MRLPRRIIAASDGAVRVLMLTTFGNVGHGLMKIGARDRVQAVICAYESGLVAAG